MGQTRVYVGTSVSRAITDSHVPDSAKTGIQKALLQHGEVVDYILDEFLGSIAVRAERMYEYARRGQYTHGLPSGQFINTAAGSSQVEAVLAEIEGGSITLDYARYGPANDVHIGWMTLIAERGYNFATNELTSLSATVGFPVYLHDMEVFVPPELLDTLDQSTLAQWGTAACAGYTPQRTTVTPASREMVQPSPIRAGNAGSAEHLLVTYTWRNTVTNTNQFGSFEIPIEGFNPDDRYFHAKYSIGGVTKFWMYQDGQGTYPVLDELFDRGPQTNGTFFPFAYFRHNRQSEISDTTTDAYRTTKKLVKYIGMDYDQVATTIDANPDIAQIEQAVLMFAVPANTQNPMEVRYLWDFFNNMYLSLDSDQQFRSEAEQAFYADGYGVQATTVMPMRSMVIQDARFKMTLSHIGIYKRRVAGSVGAVGSYALHYSQVVRSLPVYGETGDINGYSETPVTYHRYRKQISTGFYDEVTVVGLIVEFDIDGSLSVTADESDSILIVPLDYSITSTYSIPDREVLYARAAHFVFNSKVMQHLKWYQTDLFQFVMLAISVVMLVYSAGTSDTAYQILGLLASGSFAAAAWLIAKVIIEYIFWLLVFRLFVKLVGVEAAFVIAIVAAVVGISSQTETPAVSGTPFAAELLTLSSNMVIAIGAETKADMEDLLKERQQFEEMAALKKAELKTAEELLDQNIRLSPILIYGETPAEFYDRTVHSGNIGIVGIDAVSVFVESKLRLPKLNDTFGELYDRN